MTSIYKYFLSIILIVIISISVPIKTYAESTYSIGKLFIVGTQKTIINYEKSQPSSIDNPVIDPNFNVMRTADTQSTKALYIVLGLLIAATIIPLATWWYFSK